MHLKRLPFSPSGATRGSYTRLRVPYLLVEAVGEGEVDPGLVDECVDIY